MRIAVSIGRQKNSDSQFFHNSAALVESYKPFYPFLNMDHRCEPFLAKKNIGQIEMLCRTYAEI